MLRSSSVASYATKIATRFLALRMVPFVLTARTRGGLARHSLHTTTWQLALDGRLHPPLPVDIHRLNHAPSAVVDVETTRTTPAGSNGLGLGLNAGLGANLTTLGAVTSTHDVNTIVNKKFRLPNVSNLNMDNNDSYIPLMHTDNIRCIQHNLERSLIPTHELCVLMDNLKADLALVQEPYTGNSTSIRGFSSTVSKFHSKTVTQPVSAIILRNKQLQMKLDKQLSNGNITVTTVVAKGLSIAIVNVYFPPRDPDFSTHLEKLSEILFLYPDAIIAGDFNCRHPSWGDRVTNPNGEMLYDFIESNDLIISNDLVTTCHTHNGSSAIDLTLSCGQLANRVSNWHCSRDTSSDHSIIWFDIEFHASKIQGRPTTWKYVENNQTEWDAFHNNLDSNICSTLHQLTSCATSSNSVDFIVNQIQDTILCTAGRTLRPKGRPKLIKNMQPAWWDDECMNARRIFQASRNSGEASENKRIYQRLLRSKRTASWKSFIDEADNPSAWGNLYRIIKNQMKSTNDDSLFLDCQSENSIKQKLGSILDHFFPSDEHVSHNQVIQTAPINRPGTIHLSYDTIVTLLTDYINPKKAPGIDGVTNGMLKHLDQRHVQIIASIFQKCISLEYFPEAWKSARVVLVPKPGKDSYTELSSYRPISLLPCLGKMLEKMLAEWLDQFLEDNHLVNKNQYGFRKNCSAIDALDHLVKSTREKRQTGHKVAIITFDIKGAFDNVPWSSVLNQLNLLGVPTKLVNIIASFLSDRKVECCYGNITVQKQTSRGTPQGSVLSPLLWNIVMNSFLNSYNNRNSSAIAYADDISIVCWNKNKTDLQDCCINAVNKVLEWCQNNSLELSLSKTNFICIGTKLDNVMNIPQSSSIKILGVIIDDRLRFHEHIKQQIVKCQKASRYINKYCRLNFGLDCKKRIQLYTAWLRPILTYGSEIWAGSLSKLSIQKLKSCEHQFLKFAVKGYRTISYVSAQTLSKVTDIETFLREKLECHLVRTRDLSALPVHLKPIASYGYTRPLTANMLLRRIKFSRTKPSADITITLGVNLIQDQLIVGFIIKLADGFYRKKFAASSNTSKKFAYSRALLGAIQYLTEEENIRDSTVVVQSNFPLLLCGKRKFGPNQIKVMKLISDFNVCLVAIKATETDDDTIVEMKNYISSIGKVQITQKEVPKGTIHRLISRSRPAVIRNDNLKEFFPGQVPSWFETDFYVTAFLTGHGPFNEYLHRFKKLNTDLCPCNAQVSQTVKHILTECPTYENQVVNCFDSRPQILSEFVKDARSITRFRTLTKDIYSSLLRQQMQEPLALSESPQRGEAQ